MFYNMLEFEPELECYIEFWDQLLR